MKLRSKQLQWKLNMEVLSYATILAVSMYVSKQQQQQHKVMRALQVACCTKLN